MQPPKGMIGVHVHPASRLVLKKQILSAMKLTICGACGRIAQLPKTRKSSRKYDD